MITPEGLDTIERYTNDGPTIPQHDALVLIAEVRRLEAENTDLRAKAAAQVLLDGHH